MVYPKLDTHRKFFSQERMGRAFVVGCAIFILELVYLGSIESVFAASFDIPRIERPPRLEISIPNITPPPSSLSQPAPALPNNNVGGTQESAVPDPSFGIDIGESPSGSSGDLGAEIKYCVVFPILNDTGPPIPNFDVPPCSPDTPEDAPRLTVVKQVVNDSGGFATTSDFDLFVDALRVLSGVAGVFSPGSYVVSEATTTVVSGTTTLQYAQSFSGDCDSAGNISLAQGDMKTCTVTNDDSADSDDDGNGGGGENGDGDGGGGNGGDSDSGDDSGGGGSSSGGGSGSPAGRVLGSASNPEYMGGADGVPGVPNTGTGGDISGVLGVLIFSLASVFLSLTSIHPPLRRKPNLLS